MTEVAVAPESLDGPARKRRKASPPEAAGEEEEKKRSRGRPRLEPKDETAQDRRRTQIRLAQRAYRNRKENVIQTLERRVQELKDTNEEMNNAFLRLHDYAVGCGLLERMPEVGRQLRETTQKFLSLARRSTDDAYDDDRSASRESDDPPAKKSRPKRKSTSPTAAERTSEEERPESSPSHRHLFGGLLVTQEQESLPEPVPSDIHSGMASIVEPDLTPDYEVITYPTLENASFPFGFSSDFNFTTTELSSSTTAPDFSDLTNLNSSLYPSLPVPNSFAAQEITFGRRFQRTAMERAWTLVTMPNPPQKRFSRVFGFCLLFEPLESIKERLRRGLDRTAAESLNNWQYPFLQLGGSSTHFDNTTTGVQQQRVGNQGTADVMRPKNANGFSMGPFDAKTSAARDMLLDGSGSSSQYLPPSSAGFGAEFYDSDEIEMYLRQRGVSIPPAADFVTVEIDAAAFTDGEQPVGAGPGANQVTAQAGVAGSASMDLLDTLARHSSSGSWPSDSRSAGSSSGVLSPGASSGADTTVTAPSDFGSSDMWRFDGVNGFLKTAGALTAPGKKQVTIDVNLLVFEMVERATCLGRSPGLRRQDINGAFWTATKHNS